MFRWLSRGQNEAGADIPRIGSAEELDLLLAGEFVVFFKHSPTCGVSWAAHRHVKRFLAANPETPLYLVSVRQDLAISRRIAEVTGVEHASPQIIVLRHGEVTADTSHEGITADNLAGMLALPSGAAR